MHLKPQKSDTVRTIKHISPPVLGLFFVSFSHLAFAQSPFASQDFTVCDYAEVEVSTSGGRIEVIGKKRLRLP